MARSGLADRGALLARRAAARAAYPAPAAPRVRLPGRRMGRRRLRLRHHPSEPRYRAHERLARGAHRRCRPGARRPAHRRPRPGNRRGTRLDGLRARADRRGDRRGRRRRRGDARGRRTRPPLRRRLRGLHRRSAAAARRSRPGGGDGSAARSGGAHRPAARAGLRRSAGGDARHLDARRHTRARLRGHPPALRALRRRPGARGSGTRRGVRQPRASGGRGGGRAGLPRRLRRAPAGRRDGDPDGHRPERRPSPRATRR